MYERFYHFSSKSIRKKEKYANTKWTLRNLFCGAVLPNLSNDEIMS